MPREAAVNSANGFPRISLKELLLLSEGHDRKRKPGSEEKREGKAAFVAKKDFASHP